MKNVLKTNLNLLVAFQALLTEGSVTKAALRVGITQSAMSNALARLREELGDRLFIRQGQRMEPTRLARDLSADLELGLQAFEKVLAPREPFDPATATTAFVLAANDDLELTIVPGLLDRMARTAPHCSIQILPWSRYGAVPPELEAGTVDVLLLSTSGMRLASSFRSEALFEDFYRVLVRADHPRIARRLTLGRYLEESHVIVTKVLAADSHIDRHLAGLGKQRRISVRVPHFSSVPHLVAASDVIAALDARVARVVAQGLPLRDFKLPLPLPPGRFDMIWHGSTDDDPARLFLRDSIRSVARRMKPAMAS